MVYLSNINYLTLFAIVPILTLLQYSHCLPNTKKHNVTLYNLLFDEKRQLSQHDLIPRSSNQTKTKKHHHVKKPKKTKLKHHKKPKYPKNASNKWPFPFPPPTNSNQTNNPMPPTSSSPPPNSANLPMPPTSSGGSAPSRSPPPSSKNPPTGNGTPSTGTASESNGNNGGGSTSTQMPPVGQLKQMNYGWDTSGKLFADVWDSKQGGTYQASGDQAGTFKVTWQGVDDIVIGKGWRTGTMDRVVTYNGTFNVNGNGAYLSLYGWSVHDCVEYYICDNYGIYQPCGPPTKPKGTFESDGDTYTVCEIPRSSQCIDGSQGFNQFWSVRNTKRSSGTIHFANHAQAWKSFGMNLGTLSFPQQMSVEAYARSSGSAEITVEGAGPVN